MERTDDVTRTFQVGGRTILTLRAQAGDVTAWMTGQRKPGGMRMEFVCDKNGNLRNKLVPYKRLTEEAVARFAFKLSGCIKS